MKTIVIIALMTLTVWPPLAAGQEPCTPTFADPATINQIDDPITGNRYYLEERATAFFFSPPIPGSGFLTGSGTWLYQEDNVMAGVVNGVDLGSTLQRGGISITGGVDPITDETCGWRPDNLIFAAF